MSHLQGDQRRRWARGERVLVEDYLKEFADLLGDPEVLLDLIYHEVIVREEFGDAPGLEEYLDRFPQFARQLGDQFELHAALNDTQWLDKGGATGLDPVTTLANAGRAASGAWPSIPGYELIRELGRGGMGVVYLAWQTGLNRLTALKMILAGDFTRMRDRVRFCNEAEAVARLEHPNLVRIYEIGEQDGRPYFSMEYVPGGSLAHALRSTPLPPGKAAALAQTLARAAHAVHERAVVHRDLTPNNVLLGADGDPKIVDFGLAKLVVGGADQTESGDILGTPSYMAPEQAGGRSKEVGPAADVYALGAILYEMLTGRPPFKAETPLETLLQVVNHDPVAPCRLQPKLPRDLETVCLKCLEKDPTKRYATAQAFADDLARFLAGEPILARQVGAWGRVVKWASAVLLSQRCSWSALWVPLPPLPRSHGKDGKRDWLKDALKRLRRPKSWSDSRPMRRGNAKRRNDCFTRESRPACFVTARCATAMRAMLAEACSGWPRVCAWSRRTILSWAGPSIPT